GYDLHETYGPIWKTPSAWKSSPEVILAYEYRKKEKVNPWTRVNCPQSSISDLNGGGGAGVTHQHTEVYLVKDEDGVWRKWEDSKHKANTKPADGVLEHLYGNRELRFYENVMTDKTTCMGYDFAFNEGGKSGSLTNFEEEEIWDHVSQVKTGYMCKKFMGEDPDYLPTRKYECDLPSIALRYAEVILNYAEACLMTGEEANARAAINRTRKRAGLPELDASADLREEYKDERHKELAFEGHRYFDLLRWAKQEKRDMIPELNRRSKWILIDKERKAYKIIEAKYDKYYRKWSKRRFLMPIPFGQLEYNPNLVQNPGW
ncbi:MAG: RagB/SusD family nutrient uptake outer membrane protein, partial [Cytophagales bacterium]|nr:RagB/SusD family nutrient uptake outer membrane protein [Cytophagales bacterium]